MNLEKVDRHQERKDIYQAGMILPFESITELDRFIIRQIFCKELDVGA